MQKPYIIGITGHKKSGKTTLIEYLAKGLSAEGLIVGTIKTTSHKIEFDTPGKDTYRHRQAGASVTLIRSANQIALYSDQNYLNQELLWNIFAGCDIVLVEGDSKSKYPKIYVAGNQPMRTDIIGPVIASWGDSDTRPGIKNFTTNQGPELCQFIIGLMRPK
ncbi:MAG: molybdopterin-guanine dinucleotide biosynthesis protein B [candidate division Zixibacteria bacterium]|nr:molybdopterin-guanine dinucleotide biosynthesis protein B [candidate division Zixibacteria bacterium]